MKNSIKNGRKKSEQRNFQKAEGETLESFFQNGPIDYEELLQSLNEDFPFQQPAEKRFLGEFMIVRPKGTETVNTTT